MRKDQIDDRQIFKPVSVACRVQSLECTDQDVRFGVCQALSISPKFSEARIGSERENRKKHVMREAGGAQKDQNVAG